MLKWSPMERRVEKERDDEFKRCSRGVEVKRCSSLSPVFGCERAKFLNSTEYLIWGEYLKLRQKGRWGA